MTVSAVVAVLSAGAAAALVWPAAGSPVPPRIPPSSTEAGPPGWLHRFRVLWVLLAAVAAATFVGGRVGLAAAPLAAVATWVVIGRAEPAALRRARAAARRDLPHLVGPLADALRSGRPPAEAITVAVAALPGAGADRLAGVLPRLRLGIDPALVWAELAGDPELGPLGRALGRAHESGAPVSAAVERLAVELSRSARADVEDRARSVGVRAAVPLACCLLPSFVLLGIVPVVAGLLSTLGV